MHTQHSYINNDSRHPLGTNNAYIMIVLHNRDHPVKQIYN